MFVDSTTLVLLLPEIILVVLATWIFVAGTFGTNRLLWSGYALASYMIAGYALYNQMAVATDAVHGPILSDALGHVLRCVALAVGFLSTLMASHLLRKQVACEVLGLIMLAVVGVMLASAASDMVLLFLGLELVSIPTYVLLFIGRPGRSGAEATAKYFFLSILSSAILLYGFSFLYGITGTTTMFGGGQQPDVLGMQDLLVRQLADGSPLTTLAPLALVLIFAGLGFKMAAVPFHFYAPDVYQGTTNVNAGLLAVLPKIAASAVLIRIGVVILPPQFAQFAWPVVLVVAVLTMTVGNVCALWQTNLRRMMGYSSIAHAGYMLIGLTVALAVGSLSGEARLSYGGVAALVFYLIVYTFGSLGTFAVLAHLSSEGREVDTLEELAGLNKTRPTAAALLAIFMFSLAGIPPLAGFFGKFTLFTGAVTLAMSPAAASISGWLIFLAVAGALNAAIAAAYYLRLVGTMYFRPAAGTLPEVGGTGALAASVICCVMVVLLGISPNSVLTSAGDAEKSALRFSRKVEPIADVAPPDAPVEPLASR